MSLSNAIIELQCVSQRFFAQAITPTSRDFTRTSDYLLVYRKAVAVNQEDLIELTRNGVIDHETEVMSETNGTRISAYPITKTTSRYRSTAFINQVRRIDDRLRICCAAITGYFAVEIEGLHAMMLRVVNYFSLMVYGQLSAIHVGDDYTWTMGTRNQDQAA